MESDKCAPPVHHPMGALFIAMGGGGWERRRATEERKRREREGNAPFSTLCLLPIPSTFKLIEIGPLLDPRTDGLELQGLINLLGTESFGLGF